MKVFYTVVLLTKPKDYLLNSVFLYS